MDFGCVIDSWAPLLRFDLVNATVAMTGGTPLSVGLNKNDFIQTVADMWVPLVSDTVLDNVSV